MLSVGPDALRSLLTFPKHRRASLLTFPKHRRASLLTFPKHRRASLLTFPKHMRKRRVHAASVMYITDISLRGWQGSGIRGTGPGGERNDGPVEAYSRRR